MYRVVQVLSAGGFGQTYLVQDISITGHPACVVKQLKPVSNYPDLLSLRQLFDREVEALKKLGAHEQQTSAYYRQVPQLLDHFEENEQFYLVQEFITGQPLSAELQPGKPWSESQVIQLLQEVLGILEFVHSYGLIHRDIKPSNLIRRKQDNRLVLIDFGSVKQAWKQVVTAQGQTNASLALGIPATIAIGTPGYMPTEQERGRPRPNSDIYALGMIGIQAVTGLSPTQLLEDSNTGEIIWQAHAQVSAELTSVLNKMVCYHFKDRYQSATEALQALQLVSKQVVAASRNSVAPLPPASSPRKSALLISFYAGVAATLALIFGSYYLLQSPAPASKAQQNSISQSKDSRRNITAKTLNGHKDSVWSVALSQDGQTLISGSADKTIKVWNLNTGQPERTLVGHTDTVRSVALSQDQQTLISASGDKSIKLWNLPSGRQLRTLTGHVGPVWAVALSADGKTLISGGEDRTIKIWNLSTGKLRRTLTGHADRVFGVALSPDGQRIVSASKDKTIKIWHLQTGELIHTLTGHSDSVRSVAISPDGEKFASSSWDKTIKIWKLPTGQLLRTLKGHTGRVVWVAFSPNGNLVSTSLDKTVKVWDLQTGQLLSNLTGHSDWVLSVATSSTKQTIASSSKDKTIKIWQ